MSNYRRKPDEKSGRRPYKGRGNKGKPKLPDKLRDQEDGKEISNDPNWYFSNPVLAEQVSRFAFNQFLGVPFTLDASNRIPSEMKLPTIMKVNVAPSAGWTDPTTPQRSGINTAGLKLYTTLSARNAKTTSYAPQDVTILTLALGSLLSYISYMRRFFGLTYVYSVRNRTYAKYICEVMSLDFNDFVSKRADYLAQFNFYINTINKIAFPANIPYFEKCRSLFDSIYVDAESTMAQSYALCPSSVWVYDETYDEQGAGLVTTPVIGTYGVVKFSDMLNKLNTMIDALLSSTALNYIYSDVLTLAAKEHVPMLNIPLIPDDYGIVPEYSANFKLQISNATILGQALPQNLMYDDGMHFTHDNDVKCDATLNCIRYTPQFKSPIPIMGIEHVLDFPYDNPDVTNIIESTRYAVRAQCTLEEANYYTNQISLADQYLTTIQVYSTGSTADITLSSSGFSLSSSIAAVAIALLYFDAYPRIYRWVDGTGFTGMIGDTTYFTTVTEGYLSRVDDICMQGLFDLR